MAKKKSQSEIVVIRDGWDNIDYVVDHVDNGECVGLNVIAPYNGKVVAFEVGKWSKVSEQKATVAGAKQLVKEIQRFIDKAEKFIVTPIA